MTDGTANSPSRDEGQRRLSYDVRIWKTRVVNGARGRAYQVRWTVGGKVRYATFATKALADSHEAKLKTASREGEAFDIGTGLPLSMATEGRDKKHERQQEVSWYEFACAYVDVKWQEVSPNSRRAIADALATATPALLTTRNGAPKPADLRKALYGWAFNTKLREAGPPAQLTPTIKWVERNTADLADLSDADTLRRVLNQLARKIDGTPAAATVVARKRAVLFNLLGYAVDKKHFTMNPMISIKWKSPKAAEAIDRRRVVNPRQAQALLDAVAKQGPMGRHLQAFFGCMYHVGLRPAEAVMLTRDEVQLSEPTVNGDGYIWRTPPLPAAAPGMTAANAANRASSNTAPPRKSARYRFRPRWPDCCATTSPNTAPRPMVACFAARAAACSPTPSTAARGRKPAKSP